MSFEYIDLYAEHTDTDCYLTVIKLRYGEQWRALIEDSQMVDWLLFNLSCGDIEAEEASLFLDENPLFPGSYPQDSVTEALESLNSNIAQHYEFINGKIVPKGGAISVRYLADGEEQQCDFRWVDLMYELKEAEKEDQFFYTYSQRKASIRLYPTLYALRHHYSAEKYSN